MTMRKAKVRSRSTIFDLLCHRCTQAASHDRIAIPLVHMCAESGDDDPVAFVEEYLRQRGEQCRQQCEGNWWTGPPKGSPQYEVLMHFISHKDDKVS